MKIFNSNALMITGFVISFVAIVFNAIILTNISGKIGAIDSESLRLNEALREQTNNGNEAETKFNDFLMAKSIADNAPVATRESASLAASAILNEAVTFLFAAANDIPMLEIRRTESEEEANSPETQRMYEEAKKESEAVAKAGNEKTNQPKKESGPSAENSDETLLKQAQQEIETFDVEAGYTNLPKKISAIETIADAVAVAENTEQMAVRLYPVNKALNAKWLETTKIKQNRLHELAIQKGQMTRYQNYSTFAALSLQMLGLMIVFLKDVLKTKDEPK